MVCCNPVSCLLVTAVLFVGMAYYLYTPLPEGVAEPRKFQAIMAIFKTVDIIGDVCENLGIESKINVTRKSMSAAVSVKSKSDPDLEVTDTTFEDVPVRIYKPKTATEPSPAMVYFHGGGWVLADVDFYDAVTSLYAKSANIIVISVDYRKAPEHPFPVPFEDCLQATQYVLKNARNYGIDPKRVAVGGDSAGGNLAAAVSLYLSERPDPSLPPLKTQLLIYPALQALDFQLPSYKLYGKVGFLTDISMVDFWLLYMGLPTTKENQAAFLANNHISRHLQSSYASHVDQSNLPEEMQSTEKKSGNVGESNAELSSQIEATITNPYFAPLMAKDLSKVPPAIIILAGVDVLRDDGLLYYKRLEKAKVKVTLEVVKEALHAQFLPDFDIGVKTLTRAANLLKTSL